MRRLLFLLLALATLGALLTACGRGRRPSSIECYEATDCEAEPGQLTACIDGDCEVVECFASSDCELGQYCNVEALLCTEGCQGDEDCAAGDVCSDNTCVSRGCRSSVLDCPHGTECVEATGNCEPISGSYCDICTNDPLYYQWDTQGTFDSCDDTWQGHLECGSGAFCLDDGFGEGRCYPPCDPQDEAPCPWGFECGPITIDRSGPPCNQPNPAILGYACIAMSECSDMPF